jgi:hypothetical protein
MRPHLAVVDTETGEVKDDCAGCAELRAQLAGAERDVRSWRSRYAALERDKERDAQNHEVWKPIAELHRYWRTKCNHPRSKFGADEFWMALPIWQEYGEDMCRRGIDGAAYDPYTTTRRNGSKKRHDGWELIFKNRPKFEEFVNRAPINAPQREGDGANQGGTK